MAMRVVVIPRAGEPDIMQIVERPRPVPAAGEVAIDVAYCGCNWADTMMCRNTYPHPVTYPATPGFEVSGHVRAVGEGVAAIRPGDRVAAYLPHGAGYAETCIAPAECVVPLPSAIALDIGAAFLVQALTAYHLLHTFGRVERGWIVLIHAIGGGVGLCCTQLAVKAGATVIGTVGTAGKEKKPLELGATRVVDRGCEDFVAACQEISAGRGVDLVLDSVGATTLDRSFSALKTLGHVVSYGEAEGRPFANLWERLVPKSLTLSRFHLGHIDPRSPSWRTGLDHVMDGLATGWLKMTIVDRFPFEQAAAMHKHLESRQVAGKLLLSVKK
jgi:NADPH2:quinone reductase